MSEVTLILAEGVKRNEKEAKKQGDLSVPLVYALRHTVCFCYLLAVLSDGALTATSIDEKMMLGIKVFLANAI